MRPKKEPLFIGDPFPRMHKIVPEGQSNAVSVVHQEVTQDIYEHTVTQSIIKRDRNAIVDPGIYAQLFVHGQIMMSDVYMERRSNMKAYRHANGKVLIAGLGLGMIVHAIAAKKEVESVTVVEINPDVIKLVAHTLPKGVKVVSGDIFHWRPARDEKFNTIYFDIWRDISTENLTDMTILHRAFTHRVNRKDGTPWMGSWMHAELKSKREQERRNYGDMVRCGTFR